MCTAGRPARRVRTLGTFLVWLALAAPSAAFAGADCSITSVGLAFGDYDTLATSPDDTATTITVTCTYVEPGAQRVDYTITLSNGMNGTSPLARQLASGSAQLSYNVFDDPSRTRVWGNGTGGTVVASGSLKVGPGVGNGTRSATHVAYGRVPALQDVEPGSYLDTLLLTLVY